jgi:hypothetical protein
MCIQERQEFLDGQTAEMVTGSPPVGAIESHTNRNNLPGYRKAARRSALQVPKLQKSCGGGPPSLVVT